MNDAEAEGTEVDTQLADMKRDRPQADSTVTNTASVAPGPAAGEEERKEEGKEKAGEEIVEPSITREAAPPALRYGRQWCRYNQHKGHHAAACYRQLPAC